MPPSNRRAIVRAATFRAEHPEWYDMAHEVLFTGPDSDGLDVQYRVAQALMLAHQMGQQGRKPPRPKHLDPRKLPEKEADPELDEVFNRLKLLAWSPLSGTPRPDGHMEWKAAQFRQSRDAPLPMVVRRRPGTATTVQLVRRRK